MAEEKPAGSGQFCWTELATRDLAKAKKFYSALIGWKTVDQQMGEMTYTMLFPPGSEEPVGGMMQMEGDQWEGVPPHWMPYVMVENCDAVTTRAGELGGNILVPPTDIPEVGRFSVLQDPTGAVLATITMNPEHGAV